MTQRNYNMAGREVEQMAFKLKEPTRLPVTLIAGGSWMVHSAGNTYAEIRKNPEIFAKVIMRGFEQVGHDLLWMGGISNFQFIKHVAISKRARIPDPLSDFPVVPAGFLIG